MCWYKLYMQAYVHQPLSWEGCGLSKFGADTVGPCPLSRESLLLPHPELPVTSTFLPLTLVKIKPRDFTADN